MTILPRTSDPREWVTDDRAPLLSPDQRRGLRRASLEISIRVLKATGVAIDLDVAETLAANTIVAYLHGVTDTDDWGTR